MALNFMEQLRGPHGQDMLVFNPATYIELQTITVASTPENMTVPTGAHIVVFASTANFYCLPQTSAATPARPTTDTTDGTAWDLNPTGYWLRPDGITHLRLDSDTAGAQIIAKFYKQRTAN